MNNNREDCLVNVERLVPDKKRDRFINIQIWIFLIVALGFISIETFAEAKSSEYIKKEAAWKCHACQQRVWVRDADWSGD